MAQSEQFNAVFSNHWARLHAHLGRKSALDATAQVGGRLLTLANVVGVARYDGIEPLSPLPSWPLRLIYGIFLRLGLFICLALGPQGIRSVFSLFFFLLFLREPNVAVFWSFALHRI
jgi:hypothetical protein